jgi:hypothetical protein
MKTLAVESCQCELTDRVRQVRPETARRWGTMNAHQMICHLADGFRLYMGLRPAKNESTLLMRTAGKWVALWAPLPWPHGFRTVPELDQERDGTKPGDFERDREDLVTLVGRMVGRPKHFPWPTHPHFGRLSESEWLRLGYLHTNHHLRQFGC